MKLESATFYITRHGETDWNREHRIQGQTDIPLNGIGIQQARKLAKKLDDICFDRVCSSDLCRAVQTAEVIADLKNLKVETSPALRERNFGQIEGESVSIFHTLYTHIASLDDEKRRDFKFNPEYESDNQIFARFFNYIQNTSAENRGQNILVVTHGGVIRTVADQLLGNGFKPRRRVENCGYLILQSNGIDIKVIGASGVEL